MQITRDMMVQSIAQQRSLAEAARARAAVLRDQADERLERADDAMREYTQHAAAADAFQSLLAHLMQPSGGDGGQPAPDPTQKVVNLDDFRPKQEGEEAS